MKTIFALVLISLVVLVACHKHHHSHHHDESKSKSQCGGVCHFNANGAEYNFKFLNNEIQIQDSSSSATILFNPCGDVSDDDCPANTSVCLKIKEGVGVNYGSAKNLLFSTVPSADNVSSVVEGMYGNGELCNNGVPRKTIVQYVCDLNASEKQDISSVEYDTCSMNIVIESPLACSLDMYCSSKSDAESCQQIKGACIWDYKSDSCQSLTSSYTGPQHGAVFSIVALLGFVFVLLGCSLCLCCVAIKKRRNRRRLQRRAAMATRKTRKSSKKQPKINTVQYQPLSGGIQHIQLVPGNFAPMNGPYSAEVPLGHFPMYPIVVQSVNNNQ